MVDVAFAESLGPYPVARLPEVQFGDPAAVELDNVEHRHSRVAGAPVYPVCVEAQSDVFWIGAEHHVMELAGGVSQLDVVVVGGLSKPGLIANFPSLYRGKHLAHPCVSHTRGCVIEASAESGQAMLDIDGEPRGFLPARIELLPKAIGLFGLPRYVSDPTGSDRPTWLDEAET